jgi:hypothetical protein
LSILDIHSEEMIQAGRDTPFIPRPITRAVQSTFPQPTIMDTAVSGAISGTAKAGAFVADMLGMSWETGASSDIGDSLRNIARDQRPDPQTANTAEQIVFGVADFAVRAAGYVAAAGPVVGSVLTAGDEAMSASDELKRQGVDLATRTKAGAVQGLGAGIGVALPMAGKTLAETAALVAAGGPATFMAQQAATRAILQAADYDKIAMQYDPLDPVGLAVSTLVPAGFGVHGLRVNKARAAAEADARLIARETPGDLTPTARAVSEAWRPSEEQVDAARVSLLVENRRASSLADDIPGLARHEEALSRAEEQMARGEPVEVADVAPVKPPPLMDTRGQGARFHGTSREIGSLSDEYAMVGDNRNIYGAGFYTTDAVDIAAGYMKKGRGGEPTLYEVTEQPAKLYDMDQPLTVSDRFMLERVMGDNDYTGADSLLVTSKTLREWFDNFRQSSQDFGLSRDDVQEVWDSVRTNLEDKDYRGYKHTGGDKTGKQPHEVRIFWFPEQDVSIQRSRLDDFRERLATGARAAQREAKSAGLIPEKPTRAEVTPPKEGAEPAAARPPEPPQKPAEGAEPQTPGQKSEAQAMTARLDAIREQHPDLMVMLDGMEKPAKMADFLDFVKREADKELADAPDFMDAANCALLNGP